MKHPSPDPAPALTRGLRLLELLNSEGASSLEQLTGVSGFPKSSVYRLLESLESAGAVRRDPVTRRYHARAELVPIGDEAAGRSLRATGRPILLELAARTGQTAELYRVDADGPVMVDRCEPETAEVRAVARIGWRRDLGELDALTQVTLAFGNHSRPATLDAWAAGRDRRPVTDEEADAVLAQVREQRVALDLDFNGRGIRRCAAPVIDADHRLIGIVALAEVVRPGEADPDADMTARVTRAGRRLSCDPAPVPS